MKAVEEGYLYKINNVVSGRQTIKFHKEGPVNDAEQQGTSVSELLKVVNSKVAHMYAIGDIDKEEYREAIPLLNNLIRLCG